MASDRTRFTKSGQEPIIGTEGTRGSPFTGGMESFADQ
jgi:hypothetical protein